MIITLSQLKQTAERRLPGYLEAALSIGRDLGDGRYEFTSDQTASLSAYRKPVGLGDVVKGAIHAGLDALPLAPKTVQRIKSCGGCAARAAKLNAMIPNINPFD